MEDCGNDKLRSRRGNEVHLMKFMKKIGLLDVIQIILILLLAVCIVFFVIFAIDLDILALIISIIALAISSLSVINKNIEDKKPTEILRIQEREYDKDLFADVEKSINELKKEGYKVDSVHFSDASGWRDNRKEVLIIYH